MDERQFGPTATDAWMRCPTYYRFSREWEPRVGWTPYMTLGNAIGAAVNAWLFKQAAPAALELGLEILRGKFQEQDDFTLEGLETLLERCFHKLVKTSLQEILDHEIPVAAELTIGSGRIDLVTRDKTDKTLIITDHKASLQLDPKYIPSRLAEVETNWQLWDYAWRASQYYGEPVEWIRRHLIGFSPTARGVLFKKTRRAHVRTPITGKYRNS